MPDAAPATSPLPLLRMTNIVKQYPGVRALNGVSLDLHAGEVHALVGENGAGKSTLMKILAGAIGRDGGEILVDGAPVQLSSPASAQALGIGIIYQDFRLVPDLTVAENVLLGHEPVSRDFHILDVRRANETVREILGRLGESFDVSIPVAQLTTAQRQMTEIAKALSRNVRILVMDEPTAPLTSRETDNLFRVIRNLKESGVAVIYISHRLEEIFRVADRVTILRDGSVVSAGPAAEMTTESLIRHMVGRSVENEYPFVQRKTGEEILRVEALRTARIRNVSFNLFRGEILGFAGLVGAGRSEVARAIFGADPVLGRSILLDGKHIAPSSPEAAIRSGVALLTEDRNTQGLFLERSVRDNVTISGLSQMRKGPFVDGRKEKTVVREFVDTLRIKAPNQEVNVETLSGGNRQKVVLARWLLTNARLIIFDEPTVGIDVGVKYEIYMLMNDLAARGVGVIMISSDLPELLGICDRIAVMCDGRLNGILARHEATREKVMALATAFA